MRSCTAFVMLVALSGCGEDTCSASGLSAALVASAPGDVVELARCRVEGAFVVPAGVTLRGAGDESVLASAGATDLVVELEAGARLEALRVEASGRAGVVTRGDAEVRDVTIDLVHGLGVYVDGGAVTLERVSVSGPISADNALDPKWIDVLGVPPPSSDCAACECEDGDVDPAGDRVCGGGVWRTWAPTIGLYVKDATLSLTDVTIAGVAAQGLVADESALTWSGGGVRDVIGVGVLLRGGEATITDVSVERIVAGLRGVPSYGVIATAGNDLTTERMTIADGERFGLLQLEATGTHDALTVRDHGDVGVWVGASDRFELLGASHITRSGFAGVVVSGSRGVTIDGATVEDTATVRRSVGVFGVQEIGDGVQLTGSYDAVHLANVTIRGNERVGLLVDLGGATSPTFSGVSVDASGVAFGALAGTRDASRGVITVSTPAGWDSGITRSGVAVANDPTASGDLAAIVTALPDQIDSARGIIAPMY